MNHTDGDDLILNQRFARAETAKKLEEQGLSSTLAGLFSARGVSDISEVRGTLKDLLPPSSMKNAVEMGSILADCVQDRSRVLIVSDYDCDGATACSVLIRAFQGAKMNFSYLVPDRFKHGYGLTPSIVEEAAALNPKPAYIITVDNGISSTPGVERARELGIQVLVTDHHHCPAVLPNARLIVNPQQSGDTFESKAVAGCGVAWYVATAMFEELQRRKMEVTFRPADLLPYVALGTIADIVVLDKNNRILVREGLERIRSADCSYGIQELIDVSKRNMDNLTCQDVGFAVGPRINASGRLAHMSAGIECLTTKDPELAAKLAEQLHETNEERKAIQKQVAIEAEEISAKQPNLGDRKSIVVFEPEWHEGVVGIVAGRMKDEYHRPAFVLTMDKDGDIKGSGRSISGLHLKHALDEISVDNPSVLLRFGGHAMAAGVTINPEKLDEFRKAFESICERDLTNEMLTRRLEHDGPLPEYAYNEGAIHEMNREVWGQGFPQPIFVDRFPITAARTMGGDNSHLKLTVKRGDYAYDMVAFGEGARIDMLPREVEVAFTPSLNVWKGRVSVQLMSEKLLNVPKLELKADAEVETRKEKDERDLSPAELVAREARQSVASVFARMRP